MKALSFGNFKRGVATLEILIAFAILMLSMTAVILVVFGNQSILIDTQVNAEALSKAQAQLEKVRADSRQDFSSIVLGTQTTTETSGSLTYTKTLTAAPDPNDPTNSDKKLLTSLISWITGGRTLNITLSTLITNPVAGNTCTPTVSDTNAWKTPASKNWDMGQLGINNNSGNGFGVANIAVFKGKLYITMYSTANNGVDGGKTFFALTIPSDQSQPPTKTGSINLDPAFAPHTTSGVRYSANAIAVGQSGGRTYAYVANATSLTTGQLQVVDVTDPQPVLVKTFKIPGNTGYGNSIFYKGGYVYLGLTSAGGAKEFNIFDVGGGTGSPTNPILLGGYTTGGHAVNSIFVKGNYAYIAIPNNASPANEIMTIVDIIPTSGTFKNRVGGWVDSANLPGAATNHGETLFVTNNSAYLGRTYGTKEFNILNIATPASVSLSGSKDIGSANDTTVYGLAVSGTLAFLETPSQFQVWDISNPASIQSWATLDLSILGGSGSDLNCSGSYFYLPIASSQGQQKDLLAVITANSYTLSNGGDISVVQGSAGNTSFTKTFVSGFPTASTLSVSGLPAGSSASFTNGSCTPNCTGSVTITASASTPVNTYPITIGTGIASTTFNVSVSAKATPTISALIYNAANNQQVSSVSKGTTVYNKATVSGPSGTPTGNVTFTLYTNSNSCSGGNSQEIIALSSGTTQSSNYKTDTNNNPKQISYRVSYAGNSSYVASSTACIPLAVN